MTKNIWEVGKELKMIKEIGNWKGGEKDLDIKAQKKRMWVALKKLVRTQKEEDREELKKERKKLKEVRRAKKDEERERKRSIIENARSTSDFWRAVREFRGKGRRKGENISKKRWEEHFKGLLGGEEDEIVADGEEGGLTREEGMEIGVEEEVRLGEGDEVMDCEITYEEVRRVGGEMKNGKAAGEDGIVVEFLKYLPIEWMRELTGILNSIFLEKGAIKGWETARIFPIHKGGDEEDVKNYRGVSLLDSGYKLLAIIMERRLRHWLEKKGKIGESQAGFREKRGTRDHVFTLNSIIGNKMKEKGEKLYAGFIDFKTAFDSIDRKDRK